MNAGVMSLARYVARANRSRVVKCSIIFLAIITCGIIPVRGQDSAGAEANSMWCFIGTTGGQPPDQGKGIYACRFNSVTGELSQPTLAVETQRPSFLTLNANATILYATREASHGVGGVAAFAIDRTTGTLTAINEQSSGGSGACFVGLDATGKTLLAANYGSGSVASFPVAPDGSLKPAATVIQDHGSGPVPKRQDGPHAHAMYADPSNHFAIACDLGTDQLLLFKLDPAHATLTPCDPAFVKVAAGSGPRHLTFHPNGKFAYLVNELASTVIAFSWDSERGQLKELQTLPMLPENSNLNNTAAEIAVHPNGKLLYASNRGLDNIAIFAIEEQTGKLTSRGQSTCGGKFPRHFEIDPAGHWLIVANEHSNNLAVFKIDGTTGALTLTSKDTAAPSPSCVRFAR